MALWQYNFQILPADGAFKLYPGLSLPYDENEDMFDEEPYWRSHIVSPELFEPIGKFLKKGKSWSDDILIFGQEDKSCLEIYHSNGVVFSVSFRLQFNQEYSQLLEAMIEFCSKNNMYLIDQELTVLPYDIKLIVELIENSPQLKKYQELSEG